MLEVHSVAVDPNTGRPTSGLKATIDWRKVEAVETLDQTGAAITMTQFDPPKDASGGTTLVLRRLRRKWTDRERFLFVTEARSAMSPDVLTGDLAEGVLSRPLLFTRVDQHSQSHAKSSWSLDLSGEFDVGDDYMSVVPAAASWVLEVDATKSKPTFGLAPTIGYAKHNPNAKRSIKTSQKATPSGYPRFRARMLIREGDWQSGSEAAKRWRELAAGVRVYLEGFRVLPYGESGNDWLSLDKVYSLRSRGAVDPFASGFVEGVASDEDALLVTLPSRSYLGGVFLTLKHGGDLKMLVNREGFLPNAPFQHVQELTYRAIEFATRLRAQAKAEKREQRRTSRTAQDEGGRATTPLQHVSTAFDRSSTLMKEARAALSDGNIDEARQKFERVEVVLSGTREAADDLREQQAMIHVLASIGTQMAAFVHEVSGLMGVAVAIERSLEGLLDELGEIPRKARMVLTKALASTSDLRLSLERQASYLSDVATANVRRRRSRQPLADRFDAALLIVRHDADARGVAVRNLIPTDLKSPPMFKPELVAVFTNLLSNALKAVKDGGAIRATGRVRSSGAVAIRVENTGKRVSPQKGEKWFRAFASSSADTDPSTGASMGLGLTITRRLLEEHGAEIAFAEPRSGFATCLEITFPGKK